MFRRTAKRIIKVFVGLLIHVVDQIFKLVKGLIGIRSPGPVLAIYYHQISRDERGHFAWQMDHLLRWANPVRAANLDSRGTRSRRIAVTADDGWLSFVENALPELEKRSIPSTIFVVSHRLGDRFGDPADRLISETELLNLRRDLVTVGSHSATHARLATAPETQVRWELLESRARLSLLLKADVKLFCFPFGAYDDKSVKLCRSAGYLRAFGSQSTPMAQGAEPFLVQRVRVDPTDWPIEFHLKIMNAYRGVFFMAKLKRRVRMAIFRAFSPMEAAPKPQAATHRQRRATTDHYRDANG